jgi:hypothetical protein
VSEATAPDRFWSREGWTGGDYRGLLQWFHEAAQPSTYLEIGVETGLTLALARCASIAVDPDFQIASPVMNNKPSCHFYPCGSDDFFRDYDPTRILGAPIDLAFLDGLHHYEVLLRDFLNTEKHCERASIILLHDCLPVDSHVARRKRGDWRYRERSAHPTHWAGDVWKTVAILKRARPDLEIIAYDAQPTGLVAITHLDPRSTAQETHISELVEEFEPLDFLACAQDYYASLAVRRFEASRERSALNLDGGI